MGSNPLDKFLPVRFALSYLSKIPVIDLDFKHDDFFILYVVLGLNGDQSSCKIRSWGKPCLPEGEMGIGNGVKTDIRSCINQ